MDDEADVTVTFKAVIEEFNNSNDVNKKIEVHTSNNPAVALSEFKPNFYDLLLVDINMPRMNGFELSEKILAIDINVKVCFMSSVEINPEALRANVKVCFMSSVEINPEALRLLYQQDSN